MVERSYGWWRESIWFPGGFREGQVVSKGALIGRTGVYSCWREHDALSFPAFSIPFIPSWETAYSSRMPTATLFALSKKKSVAFSYAKPNKQFSPQAPPSLGPQAGQRRLVGPNNRTRSPQQSHNSHRSFEETNLN